MVFTELKNIDFEPSYVRFCEIAQNKNFQYFGYNSAQNHDFLSGFKLSCRDSKGTSCHIKFKPQLKSWLMA